MQQVPPRITALLNQKGGVGKTTSTVNIGAAIAALGRRTLLVDLDPQSHLSLHLGVDGSAAGPSAFDALVDPSVALRDCIVQVRDNLWLLPSTTDLAGAEAELASHPDRNRILRERFEALRGEYDFVLIDCPPSLGVLTLNGLCLADEVVVPMQAQFLAMQGLTKLLETVQLLSQGLNPTLKVGGVILCMHETQTSHAREVVQELSNFFDEHAGSGLPWDGAKVLMPAIRRNIKLAEAPSFGQTIYDYAPWCPGAIDYRALAERFVRDWELAHGMPESLAGKPTPEAAAAAAAAAARAAAAAAAAAAAFASNRFTPESAAAARAAKAAKSTKPTAADAPAPASAVPLVAARVEARVAAPTPPAAAKPTTKPVEKSVEKPVAKSVEKSVAKPAAKPEHAPAQKPVVTETKPTAPAIAAPRAKASVAKPAAAVSAATPAMAAAPAPTKRARAKTQKPVDAGGDRGSDRAGSGAATGAAPAQPAAAPVVAPAPARAPAAAADDIERIDPKHPFRAASLPRRS